MGKILFFSVPLTGHINPILGVIRNLVEQGQQVTYVNEAYIQPQIEPLGATFCAYPSAAVDLQVESKEVVLSLLRATEALLPFSVKLIEQTQPDIVIFDSMATWGRLAAQITEMPNIASIPTFVITRQVGGPPLPLRLIFRTLREFFSVMVPYKQIARRIKDQQNVELGLVSELLVNLGEMNIVYTLRSLQPNEHKLDDTFKFVGASLNHTESENDFPFEQLNERPLIYISRGTILNQANDFYQNCFAAFETYPGQFILSVGEQTNIAELGPIPDNFIVQPTVPQLEILEKADLFITHGGINSFHEALYHAVPMVVLPLQIEQATVAKQIEAHGVGQAYLNTAWQAEVSPQKLRDLVDSTLANEEYQQQVAALSAELRQEDGAERAAHEIIQFMQG